MSRPVVVYLIMIVILIAGLAVVLKLGNYMSAPEDLAGKWQIQNQQGDALGSGLEIEQSGKFFQVSFEHGPHLDLELQKGWPLVLTNRQWKLTVTGHEGSDDKTLDLTGPKSAHFSVHRTLRTYPLDSTTKEAS